MRDLIAYRSEFPILGHTTYLINHSLAAMPAKAEKRLAEYARMWRERGIRSWGEGWWTMPLTVGDQVGRIIGAAPGTTVMHQNVAIAEAIVLSCFRPVGERNRVVDERTLLVPVTHVLFKTAEIQDVEAIVGAAHAAGAFVVLDAYQSAGIVPL